MKRLWLYTFWAIFLPIDQSSPVVMLRDGRRRRRRRLSNALLVVQDCKIVSTERLLLLQYSLLSGFILLSLFFVSTKLQALCIFYP